MRRALISVTDKTGVVDFARGLAATNWEIVSTGGTAKALEAAGVPVVHIERVTHMPEMMDGRLKTIHPIILGGILAEREKPGHMQDLADFLGGQPVDLVCVNLYKFAETRKNSDATAEQLIEQIDIGGPTLIRAAAKNFRDVIVVTEPAHYPEVLRQLNSGQMDLEGRLWLAQEAFQLVRQYDQQIADGLLEIAAEGFSLSRHPLPVGT
jgi:phosphoribosylaminoimidazolecarboxamide formyltransferase / IMP cyclohydrolase